VKKISFEQFEKMMSYDVMKYMACIEVDFHVDDSLEYNSCCLGKTSYILGKKITQASYWYGLTPDGSQGYGYDSLYDFFTAPIFRGKSILEIWNSITFDAIDGCGVELRLPHYLGLEEQFIQGAASYDYRASKQTK